jgi:REP element-mobilizing transposase RayT
VDGSIPAYNADPACSEKLAEIVAEICQRRDYHLLESKIYDDHFRCLLSLLPEHDLSTALEKGKANCARECDRQFGLAAPIWARGYLARSVGRVIISTVKGLTRRGPGPRAEARPGDSPVSLGGGRPGAQPQTPLGEGARRDSNNSMDGQGNKAIALKFCRNVTLRDFSVLMGGHFALLATGVDNLTIDNVKIDTNRDGLDIDACRNVRVSNCSVNSPNDDGVCLKSSSRWVLRARQRT